MPEPFKPELSLGYVLKNPNKYDIGSYIGQQASKIADKLKTVPPIGIDTAIGASIPAYGKFEEGYFIKPAPITNSVGSTVVQEPVWIHTTKSKDAVSDFAKENGYKIRGLFDEAKKLFHVWTDETGLMHHEVRSKNRMSEENSYPFHVDPTEKYLGTPEEQLDDHLGMVETKEEEQARMKKLRK